MHVLGDHFPDDGQRVSDPESMAYGIVRGWSLLTQDLRIATQPEAMKLLREHRASIYCLAAANLAVRVKAERFHLRQRTIYQQILDGKVGFYVIGETGPPRRKR